MLPKEVLPDVQVRGRRDSGENLAMGSPLLPGLDPQLVKQCRGGGRGGGGGERGQGGTRAAYRFSNTELK